MGWGDRSRSGNVDMCGAQAFDECRKSLAGLWLRSLAVAAGLMLACVCASGEPGPRIRVKQLCAPLDATDHARAPRRATSQRAGASAARRRQAASPWPRAKVRHMVSLAQLVSVGRIKRSRYSSLNADFRPASSHVIDVDQLLRAPAHDGDRDNHTAAYALGIPIIPGVPPIVIIAPPQRDRHPLETAARRRAR